MENEKADDFELRIGEKKMLDGFEDQLVGHKAGEEFEIKVILPPNWDKKTQRIKETCPSKLSNTNFYYNFLRENFLRNIIRKFD